MVGAVQAPQCGVNQPAGRRQPLPPGFTPKTYANFQIMLTSILAIVAALAGLAAWWLQRKAARNDNPLEQHRQRYRDADQEIGAIKEGGVGSGLSDDLDELDRLQRAKNSRR